MRSGCSSIPAKCHEARAWSGLDRIDGPGTGQPISRENDDPEADTVGCSRLPVFGPDLDGQRAGRGRVLWIAVSRRAASRI